MADFAILYCWLEIQVKCTHRKIDLQSLASKFAVIDNSLCHHVVMIECLTKENSFLVDFVV